MIDDALTLKVNRLLDGARLAALAASLLGVIWMQDSEAADVLAPKGLWFAVAAGLLPALTALRLWWGARLRFPPKAVLFAALAWCAAATVAYLASPLKPQSQLSWQTWLVAVLIYAAAVDLFLEERGRVWLLRLLVAGAAAAGLRSLAQRLGLDTGAAAAAAHAAFGQRVAGCFGNPNFAGGFFALLLPVLVQQALVERDRLWRRAAQAAALLSLLGLALSAGKAALLGLLASAAVAGHLLFWSRAQAPAKARALAWLGGALALALALGALSLPADSLRRLAGGPAAWSDSVQFRKTTWEGTWNLAWARPLQGWGPGTFSAAYPAFRPGDAMEAQTQHSYEVTEPENWVLQVFAETGLLGLAATLALLGVLLWPLRRAAADWEQDPARSGLALAILCSVAACLACNLASLDLFLPSTLLPLLLLLALGTALTAGGGPAVTLNPENYLRLLVSGALAFMASVPVVQAQLHSQASRLLAQGRALSQAGRFSEAVPVYELSLQFDPGLLESRYFLGSSLVDAGVTTATAQKAEEAFAELRSYAPDYVQVHAKLGRLYAAEGRVADAAQEYEYQLKLDPWDLGTVQALATLYAENKRLPETRAVLVDAAQRWPANADIARNLAAVEMALLAQGKGRKP